MSDFYYRVATIQVGHFILGRELFALHDNTGSEVALSIRIEIMKAKKEGINSQITFRKRSPLDPNSFHHYFDRLLQSHNSKNERAVLRAFLLAPRLEIVTDIKVEFQFEKKGR